MGDRKIRFVGLDEWRKAARGGAPPDDAALLKFRASGVKEVPGA